MDWTPLDMAFQAIFVLAAGLLVAASVVAVRANRSAGSMLMLVGFGLGLVMTLLWTFLRIVISRHRDSQESYLLDMMAPVLAFVVTVIHVLTRLGPLLAAIGLLLLSIRLGILRRQNETLEVLAEKARADRQV